MAKADDKAKAEVQATEKTPHIYIYKSTHPCIKRVGRTVKYAVPDGRGGTKWAFDRLAIEVRFDNCVGMVSDGTVKNHAEQITPADVHDLLMGLPDYGTSFYCVSGPGLKLDSDLVQKFEQAASAYKGNGPTVKSGAK